MSEGALPDPQAAREWLEKMLLIRRFEERAGEQYTRAKIGGFLHLGIGEEATIVGAVAALRPGDYLIGTYRTHGHVLARGSDPGRVMAELFGRVDGLCRGRGGSMHMLDAKLRFMGGYGIVGGNLPIGAGIALSCDYRGTDEVTLCQAGDGAVNQGTFAETLNLAAIWDLPIVFMVVNNRYGMGTSVERHSAQPDLKHRGDGLGVEGVECDGMDVVATWQTVSRAVETARTERRPILVEAETYRFRGHSVADPEEYRSPAEVEEWRERCPILLFGDRLEAEGVITAAEREEMDAQATAAVERAVEIAEASPEPEPESLYDDLYVLDGHAHGWYSNHREVGRAGGEGS